MNAGFDAGRFTGFTVLFTGMVMLPVGCATSAQWGQWGGPHRNFMVEAGPLADTWPEDGPPQLWHRELGDGYSTIVTDGARLYTMYRNDDTEFTVALDSKTGDTVWQHEQSSPFTDLMEQFGPGPHSTPLITGDKLITIGTNAVIHCFDKDSGHIVWKHDLPVEYGAPVPGRGYGCSPIAYENLVIVGVDRERDNERGDVDSSGSTDESPGQSLVAFNRDDGNIVWRSQDFPTTYASPILIQFAGRDQLVFLMSRDIMGVAPKNGELLWHVAVGPQGANLSTPLWNGKDLLFCSSAYDSGSRVIKLKEEDGRTIAEQLWYSRKMRIHHGNVVLIGDHLYGSSGDFGPTFFMTLNIQTGDIGWRERGFSKATCVLADDKLIILDEDGNLALATVTPEELTIQSRCKIAERYAWAAPTLVGTTLYIRDRKHIMAFDLS